MKSHCMLYLLTKLYRESHNKNAHTANKGPVKNIAERLDSVHGIPEGKKIQVFDNKFLLGVYISPDGKSSGLQETYGIPPDQLEKTIYRSTTVSKLKKNISKKLNHHCSCGSDILRGDKFIEHCNKEHGGFI